MKFHQTLCALGFTLFTTVFSQVAPPVGWGDFQMGVLNSLREPWKSNMEAAVNDGVEFDRRYIYINRNDEAMMVNGNEPFLFPESWGNYYSHDPLYINNGIRPTFTIYMLQNGQDGLGAVKNSCSNQTYMKQYFDAIVAAVTKAKGTQPIYVIEPDVWGYLIQDYEATNGKANLDHECHINDLGYAHLEGFNNEVRDLARAIIATINLNDPDAYAGILMAHWGFALSHLGIYEPVINMSTQNIETAAKGASGFLEELLAPDERGNFRGDFIGVEKNGADAGWYTTVNGATKSDANSSRYWTDTNNANWVYWTKRLSTELQLPLVGWQICLGHTGLPNTTNSYEDTFFEYFFTHVNDFIDAGFIGINSGCNNMGVGTAATYSASGTPSTGDKGWFYSQLPAFNANRPYLSNTPNPILISKEATTKSVFHQLEGRLLSLTSQVIGSNFQIVNLSGEIVVPELKEGKHNLNELAQGHYYLRHGPLTEIIIIK